MTFPEIADKASNYISKSKRKEEVVVLEERYAAMSIESTASTPFRQPSWREEVRAEYSSSKKEQRPLLQLYEAKKVKKNSDWVPASGTIDNENGHNGLGLAKKLEQNVMSIENMCDELLNNGNKAKRSLVF